jgi:hypothetical protein
MNSGSCPIMQSSLPLAVMFFLVAVTSIGIVLNSPQIALAQQFTTSTIGQNIIDNSTKAEESNY